MKTYIGIDNGISGSIGITNGVSVIFAKTPITYGQDYTKKKKNISRINVNKLVDLLRPYKDDHCLALIERPMVNPGRFHNSISAVRSLEATLVILEQFKIPIQFVDSKEWQKVMLPSGIKGSDLLKKASKQIGERLFPQFKFKKDADGMLIAEWARRANL